MAITIPPIKDIIKSKNKNVSITDVDIDNAINEISVYFLNYCNRPDVPIEANYLIANICIDLLNYNYVVNSSTGTTPAPPISGAISTDNIKKVNVGDTTVEFSTAKTNTSPTSASIKSHMPNLDEIIFDYKSQLNSFRWFTVW